MIALSQEKTRTLVAIHGWSGISLGLLLYAVLVTGTVAVFSEEIAHWSAGLVRTDNPLAPHSDVDRARLQDVLDRLEGEVDPAYREEVSIGRTTLGHLSVFFHLHRTNDDGVVEEVGTEFEVDPASGAMVARYDGTGLELFETDEDRALSRFLVSVHTELHLPQPWGLLVTGILGLAMMVAVVSGIAMHRHLLKDLFTLRRGANRVLTVKDAHTVAGSWGLPFAFLLAFTGSFFSFAGSFGLPLMAMVGFGGDQQAMFETLIGSEAPEDPAPADGVPVDRLVRDVVGRTGEVPDFIVIEHYGRADASANFFLPVGEGDLVPQSLVYEGTTGEFVKEKPRLGQTHSVGSTLIDLMGPLHFGNFMGLFSKAVWAALGFAMAYVTLTGMRMWLARRSESSLAALRWSVSTMGFGLPVALLGSALAFFLSYGTGSASLWTPVAFVVVAGATLGYAGVVRDPARVHEHLRIAAATGCFLLPALRMVAGGPAWDAAVQAEQGIIVTLDVLLVASGVGLLVSRRGARLGMAAGDEESPLPPGRRRGGPYSSQRTATSAKSLSR